jgi:glycosyltransferase involved in cell wall biosynthesis
MHMSVAMCTYNGARYLKQQLDSIAAQLRLPDELVVCDDGSTDPTISTIEDFAGSAPFPVRVCAHERNLGTAKNFEAAISRCAGDIIVLADQDDVWEEVKLARIEKAFRDDPQLGCVFTNAHITDENLVPFGYDLWSAVHFSYRERTRVAQGRGFSVLLRHNVVTGATMAFRADLKGLILPIPCCQWVHDEWIALTISAVRGLKAIDEHLIKYRQHDMNQIGAMKKGLTARIETSQRRDLAADVVKYKDLSTRLSAPKECAVDRLALRQISEKISHLESRISLRESSWEGLLAGIWELLLLRYHRYSNGVKSFLSDLRTGRRHV